MRLTVMGCALGFALGAGAATMEMTLWRGETADEIAALRARFDVAEATSGKSDYRAVREATLKLVNGPGVLKR